VTCKVADCPGPLVAGSNKYCYWHRVARTSPTAQDDETTKRRALAGFPLRHRVPEGDWPEGMRWCAGCQSFVPLWYCAGSRCRPCARAARAGARTAKLYGVEPDDYARILELQGGACAICRNRQQSKRLALDHDHRTGEARGILCQRCNHDLLGAAYDSVRILRAAVAYLERPPFGGEWSPPEEKA
jgi:hypothetical protein